MIDVHAHHFFYNNEKVFEENKEKGVKIIIESGLNPETNRKVIEESKIDLVYFTLGFHPTDIVKRKDEEIEKEIEFIENFDHPKFLGIGEIGLDYYWIKDEEERKKERYWFEKFLELAEKIRKPVIIHSREAEKDCLEILQSYKVKVVLHSFWEPDLVEKTIDLGYYVSVPAFVYKDKELQKIVEKLPLELILTETDSPFLDPIEKRNNKSWKIIYGLQKISEIKKVNIEELKEIIRRNFNRVFRT